MHDRHAPNEARVFALADEQLGYFTARQARTCGYTSSMLAYHVARGKFARCGRGVYRFNRYPRSPHEEVIASWLALGAGAVASHETALDLHGLSDVIPDSVHLTLPRSRRYRRVPDGVTLHTTTVPVQPHERTRHVQSGVPVTTPARTIIDVAAAQAPFEEVAKAVGGAIASGGVTAEDLRAAATSRSRPVQETIERALEETGIVRARGVGRP